ncbi:hypothetical protein C0991_010718 [Blastosporella zonata]|nr:hypothetical protein C0991_011666 [Blastosporella zonata]KAG6850102.1 hypothetical protein C0991_010718 [Blastosporella zonata]
MRFSTAIFATVAVLFVGVAQAMPRRLNSDSSLSTRGEYNDIAERAVYDNLSERDIYYDELSERDIYYDELLERDVMDDYEDMMARDLDVADVYERDVEEFDARDYISSPKTRLERRTDSKPLLSP